MTTIDRRRLLSAAVLGGATVVGATALGAVDAQGAFAAPAETISLDDGVRDPNFAEGRITGINGTVLMVTGSEGLLHRIHVTGATSIWKLRPTTFDEIAVGDGLYARGMPLGDGTLAAEAVWVNIVNLHGDLTGVGRDWLHLDHHGKRIVGRIVRGTTAAVYNQTPAVSDLSLLTVGKHVHLLGAWRPDTNEVDVATVFARV